MIASELQALDAEVAERVMGLKLHHASPDDPAVATGCKVSWGTWIDTGESHKWGPVVESIPLYTRDAEAALTIVARLMDIWKRRLRVAITYQGDSAHDAASTSVTCDIVALTGHGRIGWAQENTMPLAVCRAALKACR